MIYLIINATAPLFRFSHIHGQLFKPPYVCMLDGVEL